MLSLELSMTFSPGINFLFLHFLLIVVIINLNHDFYKLIKLF
jgi:hypothetical protein